MVRYLRARVRVGRQVQVALDVLAWAFGLLLVQLIRYDFRTTGFDRHSLALIMAIAATLQVLVGTSLFLYRRRYHYGSFEEVAAVAATVGLVSLALFGATLAIQPQPVPLSVALCGGFPALVAMVSTRYTWRLSSDRALRPRAVDSRRTIVFGAGEAGRQIVNTLLRDPHSPYLPVALLDDDTTKRNLRIRGIPVMGGRRDLMVTAKRVCADTLLIATPSSDAALVRDLTGLAAAARLRVKVLPPVRDLIDGRVDVTDIRDLDITDLLGRHQIELDLDRIAHYLTGKRVLVTGAGGSIGAELCRQIGRYSPSQLTMLDRDESALHAVQLSLTGRALLDNDDLVLADIRDIDHLTTIFQAKSPQVVFHAAALKHLTLLERHPGEAVKSNIWGTLGVLKASHVAGVERFVNISTDKAANPTSVLGYSKRIAERLTAYVATDARGLYISVRFGNVLGSRGSVLESFTAQIDAGGPVTVTDPEATRYFMTVQEAVQLVIQAAAVGNDGEVLVLDMGAPVRIDDVARRLADQSPRSVEVVYTGLRPGEKLHEDLLGDGEVDHRPSHPLVSQIRVPPLDPLLALEMDPWAPAEDVVGELRRLSISGTAERTSAPANPILRR